MSAYSNRLKDFQTRIGYEFRDAALLERALTHTSFLNGRKNIPDNERLEFLGDRVLGLMTAERLYRESDDVEGKLARRLNALVRKETCADIARELDFGAVLKISKSEEKQKGRDKTSILGDACEAVIAAIYLDGGPKAARAFYNRFWEDRFSVTTGANSKDPKTELQEKAVRQGYGQPVYNVLERKGPDHRPNFVVEVDVEGFGTDTGEGPAKKNAERLAASNLLKRLKAKHVKLR